jgi:GrpB-like predicted nucleotidyltransferase (UPF0157 family)
MSRTHRPYELVPYNPDWALQFNNAAAEVKDILGSYVLEIEHIGSTAVPGLAAKPQIDMLVVVDDLDVVPQFYAEFSRRGYIPRGRDYVENDDDYITKDGPDGRRLASIHIFAKDSNQIEAYLEFRDYLRAHNEERELYQGIKQELYRKYKDDFSSYDSEKGPRIASIIDRAHVWAKNLNKN